MRRITTREKAFLGIGALTTVAIFVYFIFWPMLQGKQSGPMSSMEEIQERWESAKMLEGMTPLLVDLEKRMRSESGYGEMSFKRGIADSMIIKYLAEAAKQAGIGEIEQLDAKPDTSKKTQTEARSDRAILRSVVDQLYLSQLLNELGQKAGTTDESSAASGIPASPQGSKEFLSPNEDSSSDSNALVGEQARDIFDPSQLPPDALEVLEESGVSIEELRKDLEPPRTRGPGRESKAELGTDAPSDGTGITEGGELTGPGAPKEAGSEGPPLEKEDSGELSVSTEDIEQVKLEFPMVPKDIPDEVRRSLIRFIEASQGKTIVTSDISRVIAEAGLEDEKEKERVEKRLQLYKDRVRERKDEVFLKFSKLGILQNAKVGQRTDEFSVKMVFKSQMDQLVRLLYNLQNSAKWLRLEGMRITVSDRKETLLSVELSMTATTLYD